MLDEAQWKADFEARQARLREPDAIAGEAIDLAIRGWLARGRGETRRNLVFALKWSKLPWLGFYDGEPVDWPAPHCVKTSPRQWTMCCEHVFSDTDIRAGADLGIVAVKRDRLNVVGEPPKRPYLILGPTGNMLFQHLGHLERLLAYHALHAAGTIRLPDVAPVKTA